MQLEDTYCGNEKPWPNGIIPFFLKKPFFYYELRILIKGKHNYFFLFSIGKQIPRNV